MEDLEKTEIISDEIDNLLQDSYDIDKESIMDSASEYSGISHYEDDNETKDKENNFLNFIQAVKDDNCEFVEEYLKKDGNNQLSI